MGSLFRIFKGTPTEPKYLVRSSSDLTYTEEEKVTMPPTTNQSLELDGAMLPPLVLNLKSSVGDENSVNSESSDEEVESIPSSTPTSPIPIRSPRGRAAENVLIQVGSSLQTLGSSLIESEEKRDTPSSVTKNESGTIGIEPSVPSVDNKTPVPERFSIPPSSEADQAPQDSRAELTSSKEDGPRLVFSDLGEIKIEMSKCGNILVKDEATRVQ
jgi:hypothetical protein